MFFPRLFDLLYALFDPPPRYSVSQWAEKKRFLSREYTYASGKFRLENVPYAKEPMDCAGMKEVRRIVLIWARQMIKTTVVENVIGFHIDAEPSPILMVLPTVEAATTFSKERLVHTIRDTESLRNKISDSPTRDSSNTIQVKTFPGGSLAMMGANSPTGLAMRSRRVVIFDEVDKYEKSAGSEGDPIELGVKTTLTFPNSVVYLTSTPTIKGNSRIELEFEETDKRKWFVPCPHCKKLQTLEWGNVDWEKGSGEDKHRTETAHMTCSNQDCRRPWTDKQRREAIKVGKWIPTAKFKGKRGYHLNGLYSLFQPQKGFKSKLHEAAEDYLSAKRSKKQGNSEKWKTFVNCFLAETYEEEAKKFDSSEVGKRAEVYTPETLPKEALMIIAGGDVQMDRLEIEFQAVGLDDESWGVETMKIYGDTDKPEVWKQLSHQLERKFKRVDGVELRVAGFGIDTHYKPKIVREWCKTHGTRVMVYPMLGATHDQAVLITVRKDKESVVDVFTVNTNMAKDAIFNRLEIQPMDENGTVNTHRRIHFPKGFGYTEEWFAQLTCEKIVTRFREGFARRVYVKDENAANEAIDMRVYAYAAYELLHPQMLVIKELLDAEAERLKHQEEPKPAQGGMPRRGGFISGGGYGFSGGRKGWI